MSGVPPVSLRDAVNAYIADPRRPNAKYVESALSDLSEEVKETIWLLLEMMTNLKGDLRTLQLLNEQLERIMSKQGSVTNNNVLQAGDSNAAQAGDGTQTVSKLESE